MPEGTTHIDADQFASYEVVRRSGITNMLDVNRVCLHSDLSREEVMHIIKNYSALKEQLTPFLSENDINENANDLKEEYS